MTWDHRRPLGWLILFGVMVCSLFPSRHLQAADETALGTLAASMAPMSWAELKTSGMTPALLQVPTRVMVYNVLEYQNSGVWDPTSRQVLFMAGPHENQGRFITYDEASNTWRQEPDPSPSYLLYNHTYDHNTINEAAGELYFRPFNRREIWVYKIASKSWRKLTDIPQHDFNCCGSIQYFPDRDGILFVGTSELKFYQVGRKRWTTPSAVIKTGPYHAIAEYSPTHKVLIFGGGSGVRTVYRMDAGGDVRRLRDSPYPLDGGGHAIFTADPVSGQFLLFGEDGTFYVYDPGTDQWSLQGQRPPFFDAGQYGPVSCSIAIPISTHGVVMIVTYAPYGPRVFLYKHAARPDAPPSPR
jgi:hypothetical protein